jgi:thiamine-phosphate diphosphorylase
LADWPALVIIADASFGRDVIEKVRDVLGAVPPHEVAVIERWKAHDGTTRSRLARLTRLAEVVLAARAHLWVSGRADLAVVVGAQGVHLPEHSADVSSVRRAFPGLVIGRSCHDRAGLEECRADYALLSPIEAPHSKPLAGEALRVSGFEQAVSGLSLPTYALGGISPHHALALRAAGAVGLATMGGILGSDDPGAAATALWDAWRLAPNR